MEKWDGNEDVELKDGRKIGEMMERKGMRNERYIVKEEDLVIMDQEEGVMKVDEKKIVRKWSIKKGRMMMIEMEEGRII